MLERREFVKMSISSLILLDKIIPSCAEDADENTLKIENSPLSTEEKLLFTTVRLVGTDGLKSSAGSGFIFSLFLGKELSYPVIVTNKHVVNKLTSCSFYFHKHSIGFAPSYENTTSVSISNFSKAWIGHPTEDLAIIPVSEHINELRNKGQPPFFVSLNHSNIPSRKTLEQFSPIEDIITAGYPGLFMDGEHNIPLFHMGHTATPVFLPFKTQSTDENDSHSTYVDNKSFLVDFTTWFGASGSPVFIYDRYGYTTRSGQSFLGTSRLILLGVVSGLASQQVSGDITLNAGPTTLTGKEQVNVPSNLGICLLSESILDFEPLLIREGINIGWQYDSSTN